MKVDVEGWGEGEDGGGGENESVMMSFLLPFYFI